MTFDYMKRFAVEQLDLDCIINFKMLQFFVVLDRKKF